MRRSLPLLCLALSGCVTPQATEVPQRRAILAEVGAQPRAALPAVAMAPARVGRANSTIAADFLDLTFRMESGRTIDTFSRFEGPVRVALTGAVPPSAAQDLASLLSRLRSEAGIDIAQGAPGAANITVEFLPRATMQGAVPNAACFVVPRVASWDEFRAARGTALSDSVFNDDNFNTVLTGFDMLVLRATYAPDLRSGMSRADVAAHLPGILSRINPGGGAGGIAASVDTPRAWISAVESALSPRSSDSARRAGAERALSIAQGQGWSDNRRAFSHFILARLSMASQVEQSVIHFAEAARFYATVPGGALHRAHVDMQMAAFALSSGQTDQVLNLTDRALPAVMREQNAAVVATLKMLRAEALANSGRASEAQAARLDSLGWARYGFGSEAQVQARMSEVANLGPRRTAGRN